MKQQILVVLILIIKLNVYSQTNNEFLDTNKRWWIVYYCNGPCSVLDKYRSYYFENDTIIETKQYKILKGVVTKSMQLDLPLGSIYNAGYFREDTLSKKVFTYFFGNSIYNIKNRDLLLYDFNLNIGDSLKTIYLVRKETIDTNSISKLIKFVFNDSSSYDELTSCIYLPIITDTLTRCTFYEPFVQCVKIKDKSIYGNKCDEVNSTNIHRQEKINAFPSPFHDYLIIDLLNNIPAELSIYTLDNKLVFNKNLTTKTTIIDNIELQTGIYYYLIRENNELMRIGKLLKI